MHALALMLLPLVDKTPSDNDVVAGWGGFAVFVALILAVAFLSWSVTKHLRIARTNLWEGDEPEGEEPTDRSTDSAESST